MIDKIVAEEDILQFIDNAVCDAGAFGYGSEQQEKESIKAFDTLMAFLDESGMSNQQCMEAEPLVLELARSNQTEGFKRGFSIALRIVMAGLHNGPVA